MGPADLLRWAAAAAFLGLLGWACVCDVRERRIPNYVVLGLVATFAVAEVAGVLQPPLWSALLAGGVALLAGFALYAGGVLGAGDSKLFAAVALFAGLPNLAMLAFATALAGGVMALGVLFLRPRAVLAGAAPSARADRKHLLPYGVAIAVGGAVTGLASGLLPQSIIGF
jgi:prepilin peptidase CpaA